MQRLFFSLKFSHAQQQQLLAYQQQVLKLCPEARAVDSTNLHLTLFFLGQVSDEQKQQLLSLTERVAAPRFGLTLDFRLNFAFQLIQGFIKTLDAGLGLQHIDGGEASFHFNIRFQQL